MPKFLEAALRHSAAKAGKTGRAVDRYVYGAMNDLGAMKGHTETPRGRAMQTTHDAKMSAQHGTPPGAITHRLRPITAPSSLAGRRAASRAKANGGPED